MELFAREGAGLLLTVTLEGNRECSSWAAGGTRGAIEAPLDLAEKEGSPVAAGRLKRREEEKARLEATLHRLWARLERGRVTVSEEPSGG